MRRLPFRAWDEAPDFDTRRPFEGNTAVADNSYWSAATGMAVADDSCSTVWAQLAETDAAEQKTDYSHRTRGNSFLA
ncbi:MAG: hypothetical protein FWD58_04140 [Firmicutes bacterium]|nr:hypothetical protein [Bacillota bacterium]